MSKTKKHRWVVAVTDKDHREIVAGNLVAYDLATGVAVLTDVRMAVYYSANVRGVAGLAATGPTEGCRITRTVPRWELVGVSSVLDATEEARLAWEREPWS
jgi:hypothetical protein